MPHPLLQKALAALVAAALLAGPAAAAPQAPCEGGGRVHPCCQRKPVSEGAVKRAPCCALRGSPARPEPEPSTPAPAPAADAPVGTPPPAPVLAAAFPGAAPHAVEFPVPDHGPPIRLRTCAFLL